ncbi:hypothetical protein BB561_002482 [Smittium simulii]|uniref:Haloacid dehalogenase-like hydrolase domain-containing protein 3 n=1 Tax=Smittium simulii TaxID=133385 RepID=A0A2T9YQD2_9FUNG|nr:hypothetical protein BB561_002482 [Smittium simulii]
MNVNRSRPIKAITFDATNTLIKFRVPPPKIYLKYVEEHTGFHDELAETLVSTKFIEAFKKYEKKYANYGYKEKMSDHEWWKLVIKDTWLGIGVNNILVDAHLENGTTYLMNYFGSSLGYSLYPESVEALEKLHKKGIRMGIISNSDSQLHAVLDSVGLRKYFDFVLESSSTGMRKPDKMIFESGLNIFSTILRRETNEKIEPSQVLHTGDHYYKDFLGALNAGFSAVYLDRADRMNSYTFVEKDSRDLENSLGIIGSLRDLDGFI